MRLIDADSVKFKFPYGLDNNGILMVPYNSCKCSLDDAPTVDAVPVVRCRDCEHYNPENYDVSCDHPKGIMGPSDDDFCSYGERREQNE